MGGLRFSWDLYLDDVHQFLFVLRQDGEGALRRFD
jgi:hypothetical protein